MVFPTFPTRPLLNHITILEFSVSGIPSVNMTRYFLTGNMTKFTNRSKTGSRGSLLWSLRWRTWAHLVWRFSVSRSQGKKNKKKNGCGYFVGPWVSEKCLGVVKNKYINLLSAGQLADQCDARHESNKHLLYKTGLVSANLALNKGFLNKLSSFAPSSKVHNTKKRPNTIGHFC